MNTLENQLQGVREELASLDPNNRDNLVKIANLKSQETELVQQIEQKQKQEAAKEQKHEELQELVRGYNLNEIFDHPDANKIVHTMLMEEAQKYIEQITDKDAKIAQLTTQGMETEDQLREANESLEVVRKELAELETAHDAVVDQAAELKIRLNEALEENQRLTNEKDDIEELRKDLRWNRNEVARLTLKLQDAEKRLEAAQKEKDQFNTSKPLAELVANARQHTQSRKQLKNVRKNPDGSITGIDAEGSEVTVPWYAEKSIEAVDTFPVPEVGEHREESDQEDKPLVTFPDDPASTGIHEKAKADDREPTVGYVTRDEFEILRADVETLKRRVYVA